MMRYQKKAIPENSKLARLFATRLGRNIKAARDRKGITQHELATTLKLRDQQIQHLERGRGVPNILRVMVVANVLGVTLDELVDMTT
jgi:ribosome-binding protein aMBF1 (putative translation factor)